MQLIELPPVWAVVLVFILWPTFQFGAALIALRLPDSMIDPDRWLYRLRGWEKGGKIYNHVFKIRRWKHLLPDGGAMFRNGYAKKALTDFSAENLQRFAIESCRAELTHWAAILPFWVFGFFAPPQIILYMFLYAVLINAPCIIAQRFNRPRVMRILAMEAKGKKNL